MKKSLLKKYADAIVTIGANVQKGQHVKINASVEIADFVKLVVEAAYKAGAKKVYVDWSFDELTKLHYRYQPVSLMSKVPKWQEEKFAEEVDIIPCRIVLLSDDPDGLKGVNLEKMQKVQQAVTAVTKKYRDALDCKQQWTIAAVPSKAWAKKVFPGLRTSSAVEALWDAILRTVYVNEESDPHDAWDTHNKSFAEKCAVLNGYKFDRVEYKSKNGTDFTVWLIPDGKWEGGGEYTLSGQYFNPNMPTEEIFTSPMKGRAEGVVVATKPLCYRGQLIENFKIEFKDGKAVSWSAEKGEELLTKMLTFDEGASMLGELALIPYDSPINNLGILFYETLFDENASCHIAMGSGFTNLIENFEKYTLDEIHEKGINDSMIHVDFMIGSDDMNIKGYTKDGTCVEIFRDGNWAF